MKKILEVFLNSKEPTVNLNSFSDLVESDDQKFAYHLIIMSEKGLITGAMRNHNMGIELEQDDRYDFVSGVPWRLTPAGHDFASALTKPGVIETIQSKFKEEGLSFVIDMTKQIGKKRVEKLAKEHLDL